jgi:hypothetical protein
MLRLKGQKVMFEMVDVHCAKFACSSSMSS